VNDNYFHMGGEKMGRKWMEVLDLLMCGTNERNWNAFTCHTCLHTKQ
jgi:hypothetical protein